MTRLVIDETLRSRLIQALGDLDHPDYARVARRTGIQPATLRQVVRRERLRIQAGGAPREPVTDAFEPVTEDDTVTDPITTSSTKRRSTVVRLVTAKRFIGDPRVRPNQAAAIEALVNGATVRGAAAVAGVSDQAVYAWKRDPGFQAALREAVQVAQEAFAARLTGLRELAADKVADALDVGDPNRYALDVLTTALDRTGFPKAERIEARAHVTVDARIAQLSDAELLELASGVDVDVNGGEE